MTMDKDALLREAHTVLTAAYLTDELVAELTETQPGYAKISRVKNLCARITAALAEPQGEKINAEGRVCPNTLKLCACSVYSPCPSAPAPQDEHHGPFDDPKTADQAPRDIPYIAEVKFNDRTEVVRGVISLPSWPSTPGKE